MSNPEDERDIPTDAASYSLNIDPTVNGQLAGITNDKALKLTGFDNNVVLPNSKIFSAFISKIVHKSIKHHHQRLINYGNRY